MERPYILHMFTPGRQMSPFDVNMAADAGYQIIVPYCEVGLDAHRRPDAGHDLLARPQGRRAHRHLHRRARRAARRRHARAREGGDGEALRRLAAGRSERRLHHRRSDGGLRRVGAAAHAAARPGATTCARARRHRAGRPHRRRAGGAARAPRCRWRAAAGSTWPSRPRATPGSASASRCTAPPAASPPHCAARSPTADVVLACAAAGVQVVSAEDLAAAKRLKVAAD